MCKTIKIIKIFFSVLMILTIYNKQFMGHGINTYLYTLLSYLLPLDCNYLQGS